MKKDGSSRFSIPMRPTTGGEDSDVFLDKSSKKEKLRRLSCVGIHGEMDPLSHSSSTNSTTKRVKLPNKFTDQCDTINHATAPRKQRSATKKRQYESQKVSEVAASTVLPGSRNETGKYCTKKHKAAADNPEDSKMPLRDSVLTKDEEEVAEALFAMARACDADLNGTLEVEPSSMPGLLVHRESKHMEPPNEAEDTNAITNVKKSRERCSGHIYICRFIKALQTTGSKGLTIDEGTNQGACVNVTSSDVNPQKISNEHTDHRRSYKVEGSGKGLFQQQQQHDFDVVNRPKTMKDDTPTQVQDLMGLHLTYPQNHHSTPAVKQMQPYFNMMDHDHSRWATKTLSKQQSWGNQTGCSVDTFGVNYTQGSLLQVAGSEHALNKGKMKLSDGPSGYEKRSLSFVDSRPTLELTL